MPSRMFRYDQKPAANLAALSAQYGDDEFASPTRSTVPLLALLQSRDSLESMLELVGVDPAAVLHLEFRVEPTAGRGKPSHTDLMCLSTDRSTAIEAKWTEPRYPTVDEWLAEGANLDNRKAVLGGWLQLLQPHAARELRATDFGACVYQLVHRAASARACSKHPRVVYLLFVEEEKRPAGKACHYTQDLEEFRERMGRPPGFPMGVCEMPIRRTAAFDRLSKLTKGAPGVAAQVRQALLGGPLFTFGTPVYHAVA